MASSREPKTEYLEHAAEARRWAAQARDEALRAGFIHIAEQWEAMAAAIDKPKEPR